MQPRSLISWAALSLTIVLSGLLWVATLAPLDARSTDPAVGSPLAVYVLSSGNTTADQAVLDALSARGHLPTLGAEPSAWDGTQATLDDFDVVVFLNSYNWTGSAMPASGQSALVAFVQGGGGLVTGAWTTYATYNWPALEPLFPASFVGSGVLTVTTYEQLTPHPVINNGLPPSFTFPLNLIIGVEEKLEAKAGATRFYYSRNSADAGLAAWEVGGRVANLSNFISEVELSEPTYARLFVNTVEWAGQETGLRVVKKARAQVAPGERLTYTLFIVNTGPTPATGVVLTDILPTVLGGTTVTHAGVAITDTGATPGHVWQVADMPVGASAIITISGQVSSEIEIAPFSTITNVASIAAASGDSDLSDNVARVTTMPCLPSGSSAIIEVPFCQVYSLTDLGSVPGLPARYGGLTFLPDDPNTLLIGGNANGPSGALYTVPVVRDADNHVVGFGGSATFYAEAAYNDGGVTFGPDGVLFLARWPAPEIGQTLPGSTVTNKIIDLRAFGVQYGPGALAFVPPGYPGAGQLKMGAYTNSLWHTVSLTPDGTGTFSITAILTDTLIRNTGPEGIIYVPPGSPYFANYRTMLVSEFDTGSVRAYNLDSNGNPLASTRTRFISGLEGTEGAVIDPLTGDFLFSTFGGGDHVVRVSGFAARDVSLTKQVTPTFAAPGDPITYTLTFQSDPFYTATGVVITDLLPAPLVSVSYESSGPPITATLGVTYSWQVADLAPGEVGVITITGRVDPALPPGYTFTNTATIAADDEVELSDNQAEALVTVSVPTAVSLVRLQPWAVDGGKKLGVSLLVLGLSLLLARHRR